MNTKRTFLQSQQNLVAAGVALLVFLTSLLFLLQAPRPGMLDTGLYDRILPQLDLERGNLAAPETYYTQPNEQFVIIRFPWSGILQLTAAPSLVYPAALVSVLCSAVRQPFSTLVLAVVLAAALALAEFWLIKSLYALVGGWGVLVGGLWGVAVLCGNYMLYFNALYSVAMFLVSLTALAATVFRCIALMRMPQSHPWASFLPICGAALCLLTASEISCILLVPVLGILLWLGLRVAARSPRMRRNTALVLLFCALLVGCTVRFTRENEQVFNRSNLYHSFFDGVLLVCDDPIKTLADFGMDPLLAQDIGKSAYLPDASYYISPNVPEADAIYNHLTYLRVADYYLRHPTALLRLAAQVLPQAGNVDTSRCVSVTDSAPMLRADYWNFVRGILFSGPAAFLLVNLCCVVLGLWCLVRRRGGWAAVLFLAPGCSWLMLLTALLASGMAEINMNLIPFQCLFDLQLCLLLLAAFIGVHKAVQFLFYSTLSVRTIPAPIFPLEPYAPLMLHRPTWVRRLLTKARQVLATSRNFALTSAVICLLVMSIVLFFPRIGAYNNGDFGRMMDAMGLVYTPEDYFAPAVQYQKVIERYDYLEPYDWTRIRPGRMELTQSWLSAGMRILYDLAGVPFSTVTLAVFHLLVLAACIGQLAGAAHRHWGTRPALLGVGLYLFLFCGSYNLGWLNSLFGEGIAFIGLMLVLAASVKTIEYTTPATRRHGLWLLAFASVYLACAKAQYAVLAPVLMVWWAVLALTTALGPRQRWMAAAATVLIAVFLGSSAVGVYRNNESISSQDTLYSGLLNGILLYADDPVQALEELGLDPGLAVDKGKHPYLPKDEYYCPPRTEMAEQLIYSKVSSVDYLLWYLKHPKAFWHLLDDTAAASAQAMPDYNLYVGENNTGPHRTVDRFNLWASLRTKLTPRRFALYVLLFGTICLTMLVQLMRRTVPKVQKLYAGLLIVLIALGALQYPLPMIGNGHSDPVKQLYLFREVYDMAFLLLVVWAVFRLWPWLRYKGWKPLHLSRSIHTNSLLREKGAHYAGA